MIKKLTNPSGFNENLPSVQVKEDRLKQEFANIAQRFGYLHIETPAVEYMDVLTSESNTGKEIYRIQRSQNEISDAENSERGLHFDLTIPFARYTAQHYNDLRFPFRRYQIQKVWRGERPQKGRFREFYQADIDVVDNETLSLEHDSEVITIMAQVLNSFKIGAITMRINNRKFLTGLLEHYGFKNYSLILQQIDKIDKIGAAEVKKSILQIESIESDKLDGLFLNLTKKIKSGDIKDYLLNLPNSNNNLKDGKEELLTVLGNVKLNNEHNSSLVQFVLDPSIARGLDYYTGTVCETTIDGLEKYGSICSGGRYADLASRFISRKLPGVGLSIGLSRLLTIIETENLLPYTKNGTHVVVFFTDESNRSSANNLADKLREEKLNVELSHEPIKSIGKLIKDIEIAGINFAVLCNQGSTYKLYNILSEEKQNKIDNIADLIKLLK